MSHSPTRKDKDDGKIKSRRNLAGTPFRIRATQPVIVSHDALCHYQIFPFSMLLKQPPLYLGCMEKEIQIF